MYYMDNYSFHSRYVKKYSWHTFRFCNISRRNTSYNIHVRPRQTPYSLHTKHHKQKDNMTRKEEITEQIRSLTRELDGIEKVWPQDGDVYWFVTDSGGIEWLRFVVDNVDKYKLARNLCFNTKEEATTYRDNDNLYVEIRQALKDANGDWVADWSDGEQRKYEIENYYYLDDDIDIDYYTTTQSNKYVAESGDTLYNLVNKYGKLPVCRAFGVID